MAKKAKKQDPRVEAAFHEVYEKVPKTVKATGKTGKAKQKMMTAIALSKARAAGADIPSMQRGGVVPATGVYNMHKGEKVVPAPDKAIIEPKVNSLWYGSQPVTHSKLGLEIPQARGTYDRNRIDAFEHAGEKPKPIESKI